jgi:peroxiredoxin
MSTNVIQVGAAAPDFTLPSNQLNDAGKPGKPVTLSALRGKPVVLAFYPLDWSPTCSTEHSCMRSDLDAFAGVDAQILGISVDSAWCHKAFADHLELSYPLLADFQPRGAVAAQYGLYLQDKGFTARATVVVDRQGQVAWVKVQDLGQARDDAEIVAVLKGLS